MEHVVGPDATMVCMSQQINVGVKLGFRDTGSWGCVPGSFLTTRMAKATVTMRVLLLLRI